MNQNISFFADIIDKFIGFLKMLWEIITLNIISRNIQMMFNSFFVVLKLATPNNSKDSSYIKTYLSIQLLLRSCWFWAALRLDM